MERCPIQHFANTNACDWLQTIGFCLVIRALPDHIISPIVTLARLNLPQIAWKPKTPPLEAEVKNLDFHRKALFALTADKSRSSSDFRL